MANTNEQKQSTYFFHGGLTVSTELSISNVETEALLTLVNMVERTQNKRFSSVHDITEFFKENFTVKLV